MNKDKKNSLGPKITLIALSLLQIHAAIADESVSYNPRVTGQFLTGDNQQLGGFADGMFPLMQAQDRLFFTDGSLMFGQNGRATYSGGLGYRQIKDVFSGPAILGGYVFVDDYNTVFNNQFWQINPGVELLTERYEARLQGYFPVSSQTRGFGNTLASAIPTSILNDSGHSTLGIAGAIGHSIIDTPVQLLENVGPGGELEVGKHFNFWQGMWVRVGGYHFNYNKSDDITGVQANLELPIKNSFSLIMQNNYDNQNKNRFSVGIRANFGGSNAAPQTLEHRMTAPIIRHQARQSYGEAQPTRNTFVVSGPTFAPYTNVWFFSPNGTAPSGATTTIASCTAEHPCNNINSATAARIATIAPDAKLFFASGTYAIPTQGTSRWLNLQANQSLWGRNTGWLTAATGTARPLFQGSISWGLQTGGNANANGYAYNVRVNNLNQITPQSAFYFAEGASVIGMTATGRLTVRDSQIDTQSTLNNTSGVAIAATSADIDRVTLNANSTGNSNQTAADYQASGVGLYVLNASTINNTVINAQASGNVSGTALARGAANATGIIIYNAGTTVINNSIINATASGNVNAGDAAAAGIDGFDSRIVMTGSTINAQSSGNATGLGVAANQQAFTSTYGVNANQAQITTSTINASTTGNATYGQALAYGVRAESTGAQPIGQATITNSTISVSSTGNTGIGGANFVQAVRGRGNADVRNSTINASTSGATGANNSNGATGVRSFDTATIVDSILNITNSGNAVGGVSNATGALVANAITSTNNNFSVIHSGNANGGTASTSAIGINSQNNNVLMNNTTVLSRSTGTTANGGAVNATGVTAANGTITFAANNPASTVTAMSTNGTATPVTAGTVVNSSTPPSQCSTDGVNFTNC